MQRTWWHGKMGAPTSLPLLLPWIAGFIFGMSSAWGRSAGDQTTCGCKWHPTRLYPGRSAGSRPFPAGFPGPLSDNAPISPETPSSKCNSGTASTPSPCATCHQRIGYTLEQIPVVGTPHSTHISAPCHFHENKPCLDRPAREILRLRPLIMIKSNR